MKPSTVLWQPVRKRAVRIETRPQVRQQLNLLRLNLMADIEKATGKVQRKVYYVRQ